MYTNFTTLFLGNIFQANFTRLRRTTRGHVKFVVLKQALGVKLQIESHLKVLTVSSIVPEWELVTCRVLFFIVFFFELICIYWPFHGYTTRSYGFMMSAVGHMVSAFIIITAVVIWESGHWKQFYFIQSMPSHSGILCHFCEHFNNILQTPFLGLGTFVRNWVTNFCLNHF